VWFFQSIAMKGDKLGQALKYSKRVRKPIACPVLKLALGIYDDVPYAAGGPQLVARAAAGTCSGSSGVDRLGLWESLQQLAPFERSLLKCALRMAAN
jgi:hypothetical protein